MADDEQKRIFAKNLNEYLALFNKTQKEVADAIEVSPQTFNTWCQGIALPRMGKVQRLADYFGIGKTALIDEMPSDALTSRDTRDIEKILNQTRDQLLSQEGLMFDGKPASPEAIESILSAMQVGMELAKKKNKEKYTPKKYKKD